MGTNPIQQRPDCQCRPGYINTYSGYLKRRYGAPVYRVSVDAGFSCPHRGVDRGNRGCTFCDERGSRAPYHGDSPDYPADRPCADALSDRLEELRRQIRSGIGFVRSRYDVDAFSLYFQAFSNTNAPVPELKRIYDFGLEQHPFRELIVSTRPDCVDGDTVELLASYQRPDFDVWLELGLQSANDRTLGAVGRGHSYADFRRSFLLAKAAGIRVAVHLIFGLPGEGRKEILRTVGKLAADRPDGIKIHDLHVPRGAPLAYDYRVGELTLPAPERHAEYVASALERLPASTVVMRMTCDTPDESRLAPRRPWPKTRAYDRIRRILSSRDSWQGKLFDGS